MGYVCMCECAFTCLYVYVFAFRQREIFKKLAHAIWELTSPKSTGQAGSLDILVGGDIAV